MISKNNQFLVSDKINRLAKEQKCVKRNRLVSASNLIDGLFACFREKAFSFRLLAAKLHLLFNKKCSKQSLSERFTEQFSAFGQSLLSEELGKKKGLNLQSRVITSTGYWSEIVLVGDWPTV